jgi:Ca-activated chloride channel family protein
MKKITWALLPTLLLLMAFYAKTNHTITGRVTDAQGNAIPHVSISYNNGQALSTTGADGKYSIKVPSLTGKLSFSSVGFNNMEVEISNRTTIDVIMQASTSNLSEVVVAGRAPGLVVSSNSRRLKRMEAKASSYQPAPAAVGANYQVYRPDQSSGGIRYGTRDSLMVPFNTEDYDGIVENPFQKPVDHPLSTFSIDVDAASYSNVRRYLNLGQLPPAGSVRIEEMINYFKYDYAAPDSEHPFAIHTEMSEAPWNPQHKLLLIGLQGKRIPTENLPPSNLVFLIDVSGSMSMDNKLPLVKASLKMLVDQLRPQDRVGIVVYAGAAGVVLEPTTGMEKSKIIEALDKLEAGGSTAGGAGIRMAYQLARKNFVREGNNRVILCTDGDFNVGESSDAAMEKLIEQERESGVFLTVLGYGMGNYKDNKMQKLANKGNGNHAYVDGISEARKVLVTEFGGTLFTIAKDVKLQIEFNPAIVQGYRLIGYENRMLASEDFNDDKKDAGELGSGHTVTALYEIIPTGVESPWLRSVDPLKYQSNKNQSDKKAKGEWLTIKFRYKQPDGNKSQLLQKVVDADPLAWDETSENFRFAAAVAEMGMLLRGSQYKGESSFDQVIRLARSARGRDEEGYRAEFIRLVETAGAMVRK